ncbi:MAG: hypothetical protein A2201_10320 [Alicyclobacillus sp. RIFOXYA1_FULL_53_8]|nr:MAG: hypothetical protein A2201_10320 [Alicyclobacillus sp. RIFOXYA1_FULL_53_8]
MLPLQIHTQEDRVVAMKKFIAMARFFHGWGRVGRRGTLEGWADGMGWVVFKGTWFPYFPTFDGFGPVFAK